RRRARECLQAVLHLGEADRDVDLGLLVARLVVAEVGRLLQRLADPGQVAVAENAETAGEEKVFNAVALDVLVLQIADQRLSDGQPRHGQTLARKSARATGRRLCQESVAAWAISMAANASLPPTDGGRPCSRQSTKYSISPIYAAAKRRTKNGVSS